MPRLLTHPCTTITLVEELGVVHTLTQAPPTFFLNNHLLIL
jgi:hypothetical protein